MEVLQLRSQKWAPVFLQVLKKDCATLENLIDYTKRRKIKDEITHKSSQDNTGHRLHCRQMDISMCLMLKNFDT